MLQLWPLSIYFLPIIGMILLIKTPRNDGEKLKRIGLEWSLLTFTATILLWASFDGGSFQTINLFSWILNLMTSSVNVVFAVDGISVFFLVLTGLLIPICVLISWNSIKYLIKEFLLCLFFIEVLLMGVFTVLDLVGFYILFEGILIPMFLIIGIWGSREEKVQAAYYFFFYTFIGSVFMLLGIFVLYSLSGSTDYQTLCCLQFENSVQYFVFGGFFFWVLAVKIPKIPFHIWLPQAHVEAPVAGSVILAGVLLKLGGYGFIRFSWPLLPDASEFFSPLIQTLSVLAVIYGSLTTCRQVDLKRIIAYSSIAHMGLVTLGIFSHTISGLMAAIYLMLAHGLVSSALFIIVTFLYERHSTRLIKYYRGMTITMPIFSALMLLFILANIGIPLSCNFVGEFLSLFSAFEYSFVVGVMASLGMVLSGGYSMYLYNRVCFGVPSKYLSFSRDLTRREVFSLFPLVFLTYLLGVFPSIITDVIKSSTIFQEWA